MALAFAGPTTVAAVDRPSGPDQRGSGNKGQYVYWITFPHPKDEHLPSMKAPSAFSRQEFRDLILQVHTDCSKKILETVVFLEPHQNGKPHLNCLVRCTDQYRWLPVAQKLWDGHNIRVNFAPNIRTWAEGIIYGHVASEHKPPGSIDQQPDQWAESGVPCRFEDVIPSKWMAPGFVRQVRLSNLAFLDLCRKHDIWDEVTAWAVATELEIANDKACMAYLLANDVPSVVAKVCQARSAQEQLARSKLNRVGILKQYVANQTCTCPSAGLCYRLIKGCLGHNNLDGSFQKTVFDNLVAGRKKMRNLCLVGSSNCAKSFLVEPLGLIYNTYVRPDGGTYQLEDLVGKELVLLNDFEFDDGAAKWMPWQYFKNFLEGTKLTVARPKNRGGNVPFKADSPVFLTAPQEICLMRGRRIDTYETTQMSKRVAYMKLTHTYEEKDRIECAPCGHCGARVHLEGEASSSTADGAGTPAQAACVNGGLASSGAAASQPEAKRPKLAKDIVHELTAAKALKDAGVIDSPELKKLKENLFKEL